MNTDKAWLHEVRTESRCHARSLRPGFNLSVPRPLRHVPSAVSRSSLRSPVPFLCLFVPVCSHPAVLASRLPGLLSGPQPSAEVASVCCSSARSAHVSDRVLTLTAIICACVSIKRRPGLEWSQSCILTSPLPGTSWATFNNSLLSFSLCFSY